MGAIRTLLAYREGSPEARRFRIGDRSPRAVVVSSGRLQRKPDIPFRVLFTGGGPGHELKQNWIKKVTHPGDVSWEVGARERYPFVSSCFAFSV